MAAIDMGLFYAKIRLIEYAALGEHTFRPFNGRYETIDLVFGIIKAETGTNRPRNPIKIHDGLGAMVPGTDRNP